MRMIDAERLKEELLWGNVFLTDNEIDALVDLIDDQPTIFPINEPLTLDELRAMVGNPVYDCLGPVWYIVESYYDHDLIMTDGTHFNDENKYARVSKRFYCRPTIPAPQWISVEDGMPPEHDSIFKKHKGTSKWLAGMYETISDDVNVVLRFEDGTEKVYTSHTTDGVWRKLPIIGRPTVTHWMPLPEPPEVEEWQK